MRKAKEGYIPWSKGKHFTEEHKRKISESRKALGCAKGKNNPMYGVRLTGEKNHNYGKPMSDEQKKKLSEAMKGRTPWNKGLKDNTK